MIYSENIFMCIAIPIVVLLMFLKRESRRFYAAFLVGMAACLLAAYVNSYFMVVLDATRIECVRYISPIVEEVFKIIPIIIIMLIYEPDDNNLFEYAVIMGVGFATFENCCYIIDNGAESLTFIGIRGFAVGVMHVVCALIDAAVIIVMRHFRSKMILGTIGAFSFAVTIHAIYNMLVSVKGGASMIGYFLPSSVALFLLVIVHFKRKFGTENSNNSQN
ncbi:MAG: PrsW family intramembrane metalloprotease [Lachnospiraceae bacterium]|nr:PrsW family intramembrane metalloprotease [Lachnospiraceae bacterium]